MIVAVIPARGGSRRIPRKNIRSFFGKPIIKYSITAARDSNLFDRVIVSTDDEEIAAIARECGAEVPFCRPANLSDDFTGTNAVVAHALNWLAVHEQAAEFACCIYATAPFIDPVDLRRGFDELTINKWAFVFSATDFEFPIQRAFRIHPDRSVAAFDPSAMNFRSQDLETAYHDAAQFYWGKSQSFTAGLPIFAGHSTAIIIPRYRAIDIDTIEDWTQAELMYGARTEALEHTKRL
jgi:pseudaminic acid cytidylyltransferase